MKAYGDRRFWELEDFAPPTRIANCHSKHRKESRRLLHKQGRNDAKKEIKEQLRDGE